MQLRGKEVTYSIHVLDKLYREDHVDIINKSSKQGNEKSSQTSIKSNRNPGSSLL